MTRYKTSYKGWLLSAISGVCVCVCVCVCMCVRTWSHFVAWYSLCSPGSPQLEKILSPQPPSFMSTGTAPSIFASFTAYMKINSKWIMAQKYKHHNFKSLWEKHRIKSSKLWDGDWFLRYKIQIAKENLNKIHFTRIKKFVFQMTLLRKC